MCENCVEEIKVEDLVNTQTGRKIDMKIYNSLPENSMLRTKPISWCEWDFEKNDEIDIYKITKGMHKKVSWICLKCGSEYDTAIYNKTANKGCIYCAGKAVNHTNSLASLFPKLAEEWHPTLNGELTPHDVTCNNAINVWWQCPKCKSNYDMEIQYRTRVNGCNCPYCAGKRVNETNSLSSLRPDIASQWDYNKNGNLTPDKVSCRNGNNVWWVCKDCGSPHKNRVCDKVALKGCKFCMGKDVNHTNSLATKNPQLASEWHPTKNGDKTPDNYTCGANQSIWWLGSCGHEWEAMISSRNSGGHGCPYCTGQKVLKGFNDMWTTNPKLASLLANIEDGYKYSEGSSNKKLDWKCPCCGEIIKNKIISNVARSGVNCSTCNDNLSFGERIMYSILKYLNVEFIYDQTLPFSKRMRFDFYIPSLNCIIETHGLQHYEQTARKRARSLEKEQKNDRVKYELALKNGIDKYIIIDCRYSDFEFIKNNILNSELRELLLITETTFKNADFNINNNLVTMCWELWNSGIRSTRKISEIISISQGTVIKYLRTGTSIGKCDYEAQNPSDVTKRPVVKLSLDGKFIDSYESVTDAEVKNNFKSSGGISKSCKANGYTCHGYFWMYLEDYNKLVSENRDVNTTIATIKKAVVKLDIDYNYIAEYESFAEASKSINATNGSHIVMVCKGKRNFCGGFRWMYLEDYIKFKDGQLNIKPMKEKTKKVIQLSKQNEFIKKWDSISEAGRGLNLKSYSSISACCKGKLKTAYNFIWMYEDDYNEYLKQQNNKEIS